MTSLIDTYVGTDVRVIALLAEQQQHDRTMSAYLVEKDNEPARGPFPNFHAAMMVAFEVAQSIEA